MLKYEQNVSHNGGGDANPLKKRLYFSYLQYIERVRLLQLRINPCGKFLCGF